MWWFSRKIKMSFVDGATGDVFATADLLPTELPESFKIDSRLNLGGYDWTIIQAVPETKAEFTKSGKLTLRLRKVEIIDPGAVIFSQLDITEGFHDNQNLGADDWVTTKPLNATIANPEASGLPSRNANPEEVYRVASALSQMRESIPIEGDGVYCPICHVANIDIGKLRTPCPKCGRGLLKFGWT